VSGDSVTVTEGYHPAMQQDDRSGPLLPDGDAGPAEWNRKFVIVGQTGDGRAFRPSDWAERLAGVMAAFRPGRAGSQQHLSYSPYVVPSTRRGFKCVIVDPALRGLEPMAYNFVVGFARDNGLRVESHAPDEDAPAPGQ
jgi:hypothetical protein